MLWLCAGLNAAGIFVALYTFDFGARAHLNQGIVAAGFFMQSLFSSVGVYIVFKEKTYVVQMFGMLFLVASVVLLSLSHLGENDDEVTTQNLMPAYIPALMSVLAGFLFGIRMVFIKYAVQV